MTLSNGTQNNDVGGESKYQLEHEMEQHLYLYCKIKLFFCMMTQRHQ